MFLEVKSSIQAGVSDLLNKNSINMNISYQKVINWFKGNLKTLVIVELACLLVATAYFLTAPRIYEANFSIGLPKVPAAVTNNPSGPQIRLLMSPQEFIRPSPRSSRLFR